jgi:hypothetical protein
LSCGNNPDKEISFEDVSFKYPSYWKVETEKSGNGNTYINASEKFAGETIFVVAVFQEKKDPLEVIENWLKTMSKEIEVEKEPLESGQFGQYKSIYIKYKTSKLREKAYGIAYGFDVGDKTVLAIKQSNRDYDLKHEKYELMENSFRISRPEDSIR